MGAFRDERPVRRRRREARLRSFRAFAAGRAIRGVIGRSERRYDPSPPDAGGP